MSIKELRGEPVYLPPVVPVTVRDTYGKSLEDVKRLLAWHDYTIVGHDYAIVGFRPPVYGELFIHPGHHYCDYQDYHIEECLSHDIATPRLIVVKRPPSTKVVRQITIQVEAGTAEVGDLILPSYVPTLAVANLLRGIMNASHSGHKAGCVRVIEDKMVEVKND